MSNEQAGHDLSDPRTALMETGFAGATLLCLDFDGTLTPLVNEPAVAQIDEHVREAIAKIRRTGAHVAIVSGRALSDLKERLGVPDLIYAGNHGFEISGEGISFHYAEESTSRPVLLAFLAGAESVVKEAAGAWIEDKGLTASIHYRLVNRDSVLPLKLAVRARVQASDGALAYGEGHEVIDITPAALWNKGLAVRYIKDCLRLDETARVIYIGDDRTDEDAFQLLPDSITIRVGEPAETSARYRLSCPGEVARYLNDLLAMLLKGES